MSVVATPFAAELVKNDQPQEQQTKQEVKVVPVVPIKGVRTADALLPASVSIMKHPKIYQQIRVLRWCLWCPLSRVKRCGC